MSIEQKRVDLAAGYVIPLLGFVLGSALSGVSLGLPSLFEELTLGVACPISSG